MKIWLISGIIVWLIALFFIVMVILEIRKENAEFILIACWIYGATVTAIFGNYALWRYEYEIRKEHP